MLRSSLHLAVAVALSTAPFPVLAAGPNVDADALYEEGRKDYNQGFFKSAIEKFEAAYKRSKNPTILYNIGLTYKKLYDEESKAELLRSARTALKEYISALEKDPGLGADPEEVKPVLAEIDAELARVEAAAQPEGPAQSDQPTLNERAEDPGRKLKLAGIGMMAGGGGFIVIGGILGGVFAARGAKLSATLNDDGGLYDQLTTGKCSEEANAMEPPGCDDIHTRIDETRASGRRSDAGGYAGIAVAGVGALLLIGGAVAYVLGKKRTTDGVTARLQVVPTAGWSYGGLMLQGRF